MFYKEVSSITEDLPEYEWEFLFINDGSKDNTAAVIELMQKADKRLLLLI